MTGFDVLLLLASPAVGSFLGVLLERMPQGRSVVGGRSACAACGAALGWRDLVPLASFVALRGRCRHCGAPIPPALPALELAALAVAGVAAAVASGVALLATAVLGWTLLALAWLDARHLWLPDTLTLPLLAAGLAVVAWFDPAALPAHAAGAALGWGGLAALAALYRAARGRDGLGGGDAKLLGAAGAWLGIAALPLVLLLAAVAGLGYALASGRRRLAFGPFLAASFWLLWLLGPPA